MKHRHFRRFPPWIVLILALGLSTSLALAWLARRAAAPARAGEPHRVILFAPNLNETAWALGYGDKLVAVDDFTVWPPSLLRLPKVGGMIDPNLERILGLAPDLLVVQGRNEQLREFARVNGIQLRSVTMDTDLQTVLAGISSLDSLLSGDGAPRAKATVAYLRAELDGVQHAAQNLPHPRVLLVLGRQPDSAASLWTAGKGTFLSDLLVVAGGRGIGAEQGRDYFELSLETLVAAAPEVILEMRPGEQIGPSEQQRARDVWDRAGLAGARVELCTFDGAQIPGPRVGTTARMFFAALHPDAPPLPDLGGAPWEHDDAGPGVSAPGTAGSASRGAP